MKKIVLDLSIFSLIYIYNFLTLFSLIVSEFYHQIKFDGNKLFARPDTFSYKLDFLFFYVFPYFMALASHQWFFHRLHLYVLQDVWNIPYSRGRKLWNSPRYVGNSKCTTLSTVNIFVLPDTNLRTRMRTVQEDMTRHFSPHTNSAVCSGRESPGTPNHTISTTRPIKSHN